MPKDNLRNPVKKGGKKDNPVNPHYMKFPVCSI
jgi:hypothetical protein